MGTFRKPLTTAELKAIQERSDSPDMRAVLWEIRRLRAIATRADQLERSLPPPPYVGAIGLIRGALRVELDGEPCIVEMPRLDLTA